jgi:hypothetical protein
MSGMDIDRDVASATQRAAAGMADDAALASRRAQDAAERAAFALLELELRRLARQAVAVGQPAQTPQAEEAAMSS